MEIINNRYRVLRLLSDNYYMSTYLVSDKLRKPDLLCFNIIKANSMPQEVFIFLNNQFIWLKSLNCSNVIKLFEYGMITNIDNHLVADKIYYFSTEYEDNSIDYMEIIKHMDFNDRLDAYGKICCIINTLYMKGIKYNSIALDDICVIKQEHGHVIKLKDLVSMMINKLGEQKIELEQFFVKEENSTDCKELVYPLQFLAFKLFGSGGNDNEMSSSVMIASMLDNSQTGSICNISNIIEYINVIFEKQYEKFFIEDLNRLNFTGKMVGRVNIKDSLARNFKLLEKGELDGCLTAVHGEVGIGKTRLLNEIAYYFKMKGVRVLEYSVSSVPDTSYSILKIMKQMLELVDQSIAERYQKEFSDIIPDIFNDNIIVKESIPIERTQKYKLINRITALLNELSNSTPILIIIDGLDYCDEAYIDLIEYIFEEDYSNIMLIFSYSMNSHSATRRFKEFYAKVKTKKYFYNIRLKPLTKEETAEMIRNILSSKDSMEGIGNTIYSFTYGNPRFIEEVIKDLFLKGDIYIDKENGNWAINYESSKEIPIPVDLEHAMLSQIRGIDENNKNVLINMAIFNEEISINILSDLCELEKDIINKILADLISKGIVIEKLMDSMVLYDYSNRILKKMIYDKLQLQERKRAHKKAADIIEKYIDQSNGEYRDDIIYHLQAAEDKERLYKYCLWNADKLEKRNLKEGAIEYIEKALTIFTTDLKNEKVAPLLLRLASLYRRNGNMEKSINYYKKCIKGANTAKLTNIRVKALIKTASIYFNKNDIDECLKYIALAEKALTDCEEYVEGRLEISLLKINMYERRQQYDIAFSICEKSLELCDEKRLRYKGNLLKALGNLYFYTGNIEKALENYEASIESFEKSGYIKGTLTPLNNIGSILGDYYQDDEKSLKYFLKLKETSEKSGFYESDIVALTNIGEYYFYKFKYEEALKYFLQALDKSKRFCMEASTFYNYIHIIYTYLMLQDYNNVQKYYFILNNELVNHPDQGFYMRYYYKVLALFSLRFGDVERAELLITACMKKYKGENSISRWHSQYIKDLISIYVSQNQLEIETLIFDIEQVISNINKDFRKMDIVYDICLSLYYKGYTEEGKMLLNKYSSTEVSFEPRLRIRKLFLEAVFFPKEDNLSLLLEALEASENCMDQEMHWRISCYIGDNYFLKGSFFRAVNYYFEAAEAVRALVFSIPEGKRLNYFNFNCMYEPFKKLLMVKLIYEGTEIAADKSSVTISSEKDIERLFKYEDLKGLISSPEFIESAQSIFDVTHSNQVKSIKEMMENLCSDPLYNLDMILKYITRMTLAKEAYIIHEEIDKFLTIMASEKQDSSLFDKKYILDKVRYSKSPFIITDKMLDDDKYKFDTVNSNNKVIICLPLKSLKSTSSQNVRIERRGKSTDEAQIMGYVYLESERLLNNFNENTLEICKSLVPLIVFVMEKHQLKVSASIDKLTKTLTRKFLEDTLEEQIYRCGEDNSVFSIIMFDLDYFKQINDKFGHQTGDDVLAKICHIILNSIRKVDYCGRYGGEEFVILLPDTDISGAELVGEKIRKKVEKSRILGNRANVTISMGAASYPVHGNTVKELIEKADQALYAAKKLGRNSCQVWNERFKGEINVSDRLMGIISGNLVQDHRNVSAMVEIIDFVKEEYDVEEKIYGFLGRIIEITEAQQGFFFMVKGGEVVSKYCRRAFEDGWVQINCNISIIKEIIETKKGRCLIDWDESDDFGTKKVMPDWKSVCAAPVIKNGEVKAVVALNISAKKKEFRIDDLNYISVLAQLSEGML